MKIILLFLAVLFSPYQAFAIECENSGGEATQPTCGQAGDPPPEVPDDGQ